MIRSTYSYCFLCLKHTLFVLLLGFTIPNQLIAQESAENSNSFYESHGEIPWEISATLVDRQIKVKNVLSKNGVLNELIDDELNQFTREIALSSHQLMNSGKIIFGDSITNYIQNVAAKLLADNTDLLNELRFFAYRSEDVNALTTFEGYIVVNIGLIAHLKSEAELAYILAHEISHYQSLHLYKSYLNRQKLKSKLNAYDSESIEQVFRLSKEHELEADQLGLKLFSKSEYKIDKGAIGAMDLLDKSDQFWQQFPFEESFFQDEHFTIPKCFFQDSLVKNNRDLSYFDKFHSHPNIHKRKSLVESEVQKMNLSSEKSAFLLTKEQFDAVQRLAFKEYVRLQIIHRAYGEAIYSTYCLKRSLPELSADWDILLSKALLGITKYKNRDKIGSVIKPYAQVTGESQSLHYFFKQLSKKQTNSIAINKCYELYENSDNNQTIKNNLLELIIELETYSELELLNFNQTSVGVDSLKYERVDYLSKKEKFLMQIELSDFYLNAFVTNIINESFSELFDSKNRNNSSSQKASSRKNILLLPENYAGFKSINDEEWHHSKLEGIIRKLNKSQSAGITTDFPLQASFKSSTESYNKMSRLVEWYLEIKMHEKITTPISDVQQFSSELVDFDIIYSISFIHSTFKGGYYIITDYVDIATEEYNSLQSKFYTGGIKTVKKKIYRDLLKMKK